MRVAPIISITIALAVVLSSGRAWAQSATTGTIAGSVKDSSGATLPGVTIEAASPALIERLRTVVSDEKGEYKVVDLRPGTYSVTFSLTGFSTVKREGIELATGFTAIVNAELRVGSVQETITVSGASPVVDTQTARTQSVFVRSTLDALPFSKTFAAYTNMIPGVTGGSTSGGPTRDVGGTQGEAPIGQSIHGSDSGFTSIDGIRTINMATANWRRMNIKFSAQYTF